jgi:S1-C subfamily serine protease
VLDKHQVGAVVPVDVMRNGRRITVPVRLTQGPDSGRGIIRRE